MRVALVTESFLPEDQRSSALRRALGADERLLLVGYVGRLAREKRLHQLRQIDRMPGVRLVVVGDGPERSRLEALLPGAALWVPGQPRQLRHHIARLRASPQLLGRLAAAARPSVTRRSWSVLGDEPLDHYRAVRPRPGRNAERVRVA